MKLAASLLLSAPSAIEAAVLFRHSEHRLQANQSEGSRALSELYPYYHTTEEIHNELQRLSGSCPGFTLQSIPTGDDLQRVIDVVSVRKPGANPVNKNFLLFGEHSRELISAESGLHFVKSLCGETGLSEQSQKALEDSEFQIVVNANPGSRRKVEAGEFCLRVNPDGVDLNRNWDQHWTADAVLDPKNTNPGPQPFSEPETKLFKKLVEAYEPTTFLTVHSGTKGMYMPWAYDMEHLANRNQPQMMRILQDLDQAHCQCPFGAAGKEVGYSCPGTCLDWVYEKLQCQYAFAFEIYIGRDQEQELKKRWQQKVATMQGSLAQNSSHLADEHFKDIFRDHPSSFVQVRLERDVWQPSPAQCFPLFNPSTEDEYQSVVDNWSRVYLEMAAKVASNLKAGVNSTAVRVRV